MRYPMIFKKKKFWAITSFVLALLIVFSTVFIGNYFVDFALVRSDVKNVTPEAELNKEPSLDEKIIDENIAIEDEAIEVFLDEAKIDEVSILSDDGLKLVADMILSDPQNPWVILVHGYSGYKESMYGFAYRYFDKGYNILIPDLRAHGESEGEYIGMGCAATVIMTSGEDLEENVKVIIEDCGYTSVWDIFEDELEALFGLPSFPILDMSNVMANIRAHYDLKKASALEAVKKNEVPILFIHGSNDLFVKTEMLEPLFKATSAPKDKLIIDGAGHGEARLRDPETYFKKVFDFIDQYR